MYVGYHSSMEVRLLKQQAHMMFEEVSSGIYRVIKDRYDVYNEYVDSNIVIRELNSKPRKVAVVKNSSGYANFELKR